MAKDSKDSLGSHKISVTDPMGIETVTGPWTGRLTGLLGVVMVMVMGSVRTH